MSQTPPSRRAPSPPLPEGRHSLACRALGFLAATALAASLAGCSRCGAGAPEGTGAPPAPPSQPSPPGALAAEHVVALGERSARAAVVALDALEGAVARREQPAAWSATLELRRAYRRAAPVASTLAPVHASQLDPERRDPRDMVDDVGLRALADALLAEPVDWDAVRALVARTGSVVRALPAELGAANASMPRVGRALSRGVFDWGVTLDGSLAERDEETRIDVVEGGAGIVAASRALLEALPPESPEATRLAAALAAFEAWLPADGRPLGNKLLGLRLSGALGAALRRAATRLGGEDVAPRFVPRRRTAASLVDEPVTVATFPALRGEAPVDARVALGHELFFDTRLSVNGTMSCASCHDARFGLTTGGAPPRDVTGKVIARDAPSVWNAAYEPFLFWDGRGRGLTEQIRIATEADMHGDWAAIPARLAADTAFAERFRAAYPEGPTAESVRAAIAEYERTLVSDDSPFDRYVRGEDPALTAEQLAGFDIFYGKARCSRCHRLPLTSGAAPPSFTHGEASALGVPTAPRGKRLDRDRGRGAVTGLAADEHQFKVPTLRNLPDTAPYFHNRAYRSVEEVVEFYEKGSGKGLGFALANFDPDAREFELTDAERRALIQLLKQGFREPGLAARVEAQPPSAPPPRSAQE